MRTPHSLLPSDTEAYKVVKETHRMGLALGAGSYDIVIKALLARGNLKDAMEVKDM